MRPLIILTGPTAAGKTELSIALAKAIGGEIISADSMQVYKKMNIGTAKITREEMEGVPHFMIDELEPDEEFNVMIFQEKAKKYMEEIYGRGHIPILVGGTGFYIQSILYDIKFTKEEGDPSYRESLQKLSLEKGPDFLYQKLLKVDPEYAKDLHANNVKRVIRALEYYHFTGEKFSVHNAREASRTSPYNFAYFVLTMDRQKLYDRIDLRVDFMKEAGLLQEVKGLLDQGYSKDLVSMQGLGYKEIVPVVQEGLDLEEALYVLKRDTRHFAKRQLTWFKREDQVDYIDKDLYQSEEAILQDILKILKEKSIIKNQEDSHE
ncbi:MAG: tRNA (adenosine(37)-N6)-dimethylallyltransferase MiaA [Eubacterium sp.]|nr:tRNA (adenosine(37)-N6)-dimethylallyltransferase MiaA [Eubacterium sp.]